jgi:hypothetical protein
MAVFERELDITRNVRLIEWLKSELVTDIANLFRLLVNGMREEVLDAVSDTLANIILISYLLGKRLGINYNMIENKVHNKVRLGLVDNHDVERHYGDLTELSKHLEGSRRKERQ